MRPRRKTAMWANDDLMAPSALADHGIRPAKQAKRAAPAAVHHKPEQVDDASDDGGSSGDDSLLFGDTVADEQHTADGQGELPCWV